MVRIDAHHHVWRYDPAQYPWIRSEVLKRDFLPEDLRPLLGAVGFTGAIAVQARSTLEETTWLLGLADRYPFIVGVVGWADLCAEDLDEQLARFCEHPKFCGIRYGLQPLMDDTLLLCEDLIHGMRIVAAYDITFDLLLRPSELPIAFALADQFPEQRFVLDHIGNPDIRRGAFSTWADHIQRLANFPNVSCKLSGMVTRADHDGWQPEDIRPYRDLVIEAFGPERLMIGSDWPVCLQAATYRTTMELVLEAVASLEASARDAVLGGTAQRVYLKA
jgi:L-fuconolactonase